MSRPIIDLEFRGLIPGLLIEEYKQLSKSIISEGCRDPLVVWQEEGILLDGHNRLVICEKAGLPYDTCKISLPGRLEAMIWIRRNQLARRNLTDDQRAMNAAGLAELESEKARRERAKRAIEARKWHPVKKPISEAAPSPKITTPPEPKDRVRATAAKSAGVSERKVRQAQEVKRAAPALAAKVQSGEMSLAHATREVKREAIITKLENIKTVASKELSGIYDVLVIDPPWPMQKIERDVRPNQSEFDYPTMTEEEIAALIPPCATDAHVFLWTTNKFLPMALRILEEWGLKYVLCMVWCKNGGFQPIGLPQYNAEFCLYARKGAPTFIDTKNFKICFHGQRREHSRKPEEFFETITRVTAGRRLEMFAREKREGWDAWGNEV